MAEYLIPLGARVISKISGFTGMVTSRSEHLNGCNRYWVSPRIDKDGKLPDGYWFDEAELEITDKPEVERKNQERGGFPSKVK